jgi:threonine dehydrogenase-like Zn-dependent dehydrogenase
MHPHAERAVVAAQRCVWLPDDVPDARATLFANLETAVNAVWDGELDDAATVAVIGAGAVGLLVTFVLARCHRGDVVLVDSSPARRDFARSLPWAGAVCAPDDLSREAFAAVFHATGTGRGLQLAIDAAGFEGRIVDLSWYGDRDVTLRLGASFHHRRKVLVASQVGTMAPRQRERGVAHRTAKVLELLADPRLDALVPATVAFATLPDFFARIYRGEQTPPCPVVRYDS